MAVSRVSITVRDRSNETSTLTAYFPEPAAGGADYDTILGDVGDFVDAVAAVIAGQIVKWDWVAHTEMVSQAIPVAGEREMKALVRMQDDVTLRIKQYEIPTRDDTEFDWVPGSDFADMGGGVKANQDALVAAINTDTLSNDGNAQTVLSIEKVGRNL